MTNSIGKSIKYLRNKQKITQQELGKELGVSMQAVSKWERGGTPDIDMLPVIADFFDISIDELFGRKNKDSKALDSNIYHDLLHTNDSNKFEKACHYCWNIIKGISNVRGLEDYSYCNIPYHEKCTRCRIIDDTGIAWASCTENFHMVCIAPEPKDGFNSILGSISEYSQLFNILSDEECLRLLFFLYTRSNSLFSVEYASEKTEIPPERVREVFEIFEREQWILREIVDTEDKNRMFFRPIHKEVFIFLMYFANEMIINTRLWYLGNNRRNIPLLRSMIK